MKSTIKLTGDLELDIQRLDEIRSQISKERNDFLLRQPSLIENRRENFLKNLFSIRKPSIQIRKEEMIKKLSSERFKKLFYKRQNIDYPLTWRESIVKFINKLIKTVREKFRKKSHIEMVMDRMSLIDEMTLLEKRIRMAKYGINPMIERDLDENDRRELQNQNEEQMSYRKELGDFLKDDSEYVKLRDEEMKLREDIVKNEKTHTSLWEQYEKKPEDCETDPRYDSFYIDIT